jgi:hypothetical protein
MREVGYVACMGKVFVHSFCSRNLPERHHLEDPGTEMLVTLKEISKKLDGRQGLD